MKLKKVSNPHGVILGLLAGLLVIQFFFKKKYPDESELLGYVIIGIAVLSTLLKTFASILASLWMAFGMLLGKINGTILLTLVYFLLLTPLALLKRIFSPSQTFLKSKNDNSRFIVKDHTYNKKDLELPW